MQQKKLEMEKAMAKGGAIDMDDYDDLYQDEMIAQIEAHENVKGSGEAPPGKISPG